MMPLAKAGIATISIGWGSFSAIVLARSRKWPMPLRNRSASAWNAIPFSLGAIFGPLRSKSAKPTEISRSWMRRVTWDWERSSSRAAAVMLPVDITARKASSSRISMTIMRPVHYSCLILHKTYLKRQ